MSDEKSATELRVGTIRHVGPLDGFRAIAILIVMVSHAGLANIIPGGFGVTIFFFLSGYLITTLLRSEFDRSGTVDLKGFYMRRIIRILPPAYITMAFTAGMAFLGLLSVDQKPLSVVSDALFLTNYAHLWGAISGIPIPLWSLDVEEHFYMIFPVTFLIALSGLSGNRAFIACAIACSMVLALRVLHVFSSEDYSQVYYWSHTRIDSILFGCCLALWHNPVLDNDAWRPKFYHLMIGLAVLAACLIIRSEIFRQTLRYTLQGIALFIVFSYALQDRGVLARIMSCKPLKLVALLSYTLYLIHVPVIKAVEHSAPALPWAAQVFLTFSLSFIYAGLMYLLVEKPLGIWRRTRARERSGRVVATT